MKKGPKDEKPDENEAEDGPEWYEMLKDILRNRFTEKIFILNDMGLF